MGLFSKTRPADPIIEPRDLLREFREKYPDAPLSGFVRLMQAAIAQRMQQGHSNQNITYLAAIIEAVAERAEEMGR